MCLEYLARSRIRWIGSFITGEVFLNLFPAHWHHLLGPDSVTTTLRCQPCSAQNERTKKREKRKKMHADHHHHSFPFAFHPIHLWIKERVYRIFASVDVTSCNDGDQNRSPCGPLGCCQRLPKSSLREPNITSPRPESRLVIAIAIARNDPTLKN